MAGFFGNVILANSELTAVNRLQVTKYQPFTAINGHSRALTGINEYSRYICDKFRQLAWEKAEISD